MGEYPMRQQLSSDNPGWQGSGVPTIRKLMIFAVENIGFAVIRRFDVAKAWFAFQAFLHDIYYFHFNSHRARVKCPCCGWAGPAFLSTANSRAVALDSRCPKCDSRSRHRGLVGLLPNLFQSLPGNELLYFAPEKVLLDRLQQIPNIKVLTTDLYSVDVDYPGEDIQHLSFDTERFGSLLCNHVLEHVSNDRLAIAECARILKPKGVAIFTMPGDYPDQTTLEYKTPDGNGHYRHYGMDVLNKLSLFFDVQPLDMNEAADRDFKVRAHDYVFICSRK
jgi:hypothetical protein